MQTLAQLVFESLPWSRGKGGRFQFFPLQPPAPTSVMYWPSTVSSSGLVSSFNTLDFFSTGDILSAGFALSFWASTINSIYHILEFTNKIKDMELSIFRYLISPKIWNIYFRLLIDIFSSPDKQYLVFQSSVCIRPSYLSHGLLGPGGRRSGGAGGGGAPVSTSHLKYKY